MKTELENRYIWLGGEIISVQDAKINVLSPMAQFGANVFEGIRCYWNEKEGQLYAFRLNEHYKRLQNSIKIFGMEEKYTVDELKAGLIDVIKANKYKEDIAVRQTVFIDGFGSWYSTGPINMFIAPIPKKRNEVSDGTGLRCCVSSWERISERNCSPKVKVGANYINSRNAQMEAIKNGYDSAIFMNERGTIAEGPGSCLFIVKDGRLITPPFYASILDSITRRTIIEIAEAKLNLKTIEREINRTDLYIADEVFLCGSAMEIMPIVNIDGYAIENGEGQTKKIERVYFDTVTGKYSEYKEWLTPIYNN